MTSQNILHFYFTPIYYGGKAMKPCDIMAKKRMIEIIEKHINSVNLTSKTRRLALKYLEKNKDNEKT